MSFDALTLDSVPAETIDKKHLVVIDDGRTDKDKPVINEEREARPGGLEPKTLNISRLSLPHVK